MIRVSFSDDGVSFPARIDVPIGHHVEHGAKLARLVQRPRGHPIDGVQEARDPVQQGARLGVVWHVIQRKGGEDDSGVADQVGDLASGREGQV